MFARLFSVIAVAATGVLGGVGPQALYNLLNGQTFNPPGYTIVMYQSCMQNQNAGNPCGSFTTFETSNGVYTYQRYGPEAPVSPSCSRTFYLTLACGATMSMSGVNENPTCVYSATLTLPQACGIDMRVGFEAASVSSTITPSIPASLSITRSVTASSTVTRTMSVTSSNDPTVSITLSDSITPSVPATLSGSLTASLIPTNTITSSISGTGSVTMTGTGTYTITSSISGTGSVTMIGTSTSTPLFAITAYPSRTTTPSIPVTTTPLFMITAWPTVSPVNVSGSGPSLAESLGIAPGSQTATILSAVALGVLGVAMVVGAVVYFRKGGSIAGLAEKVKANKGLITKAASMLPLTEEQKAKVNAAVNDPTSLLPEQALQVVQTAKEYEAQVISSLPISEEQKVQLTSAVSSVKERVVKKMEATPTGVQIKKILKPAPVSESKEVKVEPKETKVVIKEVKEPKEIRVVTERKEAEKVRVEAEVQEEVRVEAEEVRVEAEEVKEEPKEATPTLVALHISEADMEAVKAFLAEKEISHV